MPPPPRSHLPTASPPPSPCRFQLAPSPYLTVGSQIPGDVVLDLSQMTNQTIKLGAGLRQDCDTIQAQQVLGRELLEEVPGSVIWRWIRPFVLEDAATAAAL